jgi:hypothetical protein
MSDPRIFTSGLSESELNVLHECASHRDACRPGADAEVVEEALDEPARRHAHGAGAGRKDHDV